MKTKAEIIARLAKQAFNNQMDGAWFMMTGVDTELAAWILGEDQGTFYSEVEAAAKDLLRIQQESYK